MAYTTPRSWTAGEYPTAAEFNANIRDNVSFLANPPACRVYKATTQAIAGSTITTLTFDMERFDTDTMHDTVTNNDRITFKKAGLYIVGFTGAWGADTDYTRQAIGVRLNGSTVIAQLDTPNPVGLNMATATAYKFAANEYANLFGYQVNTSTGSNTLAAEFWAIWVGLG